MFNLKPEHVHQAQHSNPLKPRNNLFTCLACQVAFPTTDRQRAHYRTDWHKYNLKRKIAQLPSLSAEKFAQKVLAQQTKGREEAERQGLVYECTICRKSYFSENAFSNHLLSKKHKDLEFNGLQEALQSPAIVAQRKENTLFSDTEEDTTDNESVISSIADGGELSKDRCLFCSMVSTDFDTNLKHMTIAHGFFLPDIEYLEDAPGLVVYLAEKIEDCICLYCNGRGKEYKSQNAVRKHMLDKGHCKMAYDESENPQDLLRFYNFGSMSEQDFEAATVDVVPNVEDEIVLESGNRLGHRRFMRYYRQNLRRSSQGGEEEEQDSLLIAQGGDPSSSDNIIEPRNRKERRAKFTITDGKPLDKGEMLRRLPESVQKQQWRRQTSSMSNFVATSRLFTS